jgi:Fanconi anemia group M protein
VGGAPGRHVLRVDFSERHSALLDLVRASGEFDVHLQRLVVGDYFMGGGVLVERKTYVDFAMSLVDGRLFLQAAALARSPRRSVILLEGPRPPRVPDVHPHALKGAIVSLAVMWRIPVIYARDPEDSLHVLRCLADQIGRTESNVLKRYDRKPKRLTSRRIYMLQGLPGVGPALASRLLLHFGTVEHVITADESMLRQVRGIGWKKAVVRQIIIRALSRKITCNFERLQDTLAAMRLTLPRPAIRRFVAGFATDDGGQ